TSLSAREAQIIAAVARKTLGWRGRQAGDRLSASQLAALTGIARNHVTETLARLEARGVLTRRDGINGRAAVIALNLTGPWPDTAPVPTRGQVNLSRRKDRSPAAKPVPPSGQEPVPVPGHTRGKGVKQPRGTHEKTLVARAVDAYRAHGASLE